MMKILPVLIIISGLAGGMGAGFFLRPAPETDADIAACTETETAETLDDPPGRSPEETNTTRDYVKLNNQFVIPVVNDGQVSALVVLSLSLEMNSGGAELIYRQEPKIRDAFLQVLFDHANAGGFDGNFTNTRNMNQLRAALLESSRKILGSAVESVLVVDVVRQDA